MIRRFTKVTGLMVAAASILSMVPAMAADLKTVDGKDGTVYDAHALGGGKYVINGYFNDDDDTAFYFMSDGKYTKLDDIDSSDTYSDFYDNKYIEFKESNGNTHYIDVTTGKETDEYDRQDVIDTMERKVSKNIKRDNSGRFDASEYTNKTVQADDRGDGNVFIWGATGKWCRFSYALESARLNGATKSTIYSDVDGNYVDADYNLGKVPVYITTGSSITFKNTEDTIEVVEDGHTYELKAQIKNLNTFDDEPDAMYRTAELTIWRKLKGDPDGNYQNITNTLEFGQKDNHHSQIPFGAGVRVMQKISKAQASDSINGIKYAKDVTTCFITDADGNQAHVLALEPTVDWAGGDVALITGSMDGLASHWFDNSAKKYYAQDVNLKSKKGYYYVDLGDTDNTDADSWSIGGGNLYCVGKGSVKKWINKDSKFEEIYKVDRSISTINAAFGDSAIVWDTNYKVYSTLEKVSAPAVQADAPKPTVVTGWVKDANGNWSYFNADGTKKTGWLNDGGLWYYLKGDGIMASGWLQVNGTWYYLDSSGKMLFNTVVDGYVLDGNGAWIG